MLTRLVAACALTGALAACAQPAARSTASGPAPSPGATVLPGIKAVGDRLAEQDRESHARLLASVRRYASASARDVTPAGSQVERLIVTVTNRGSRDLRGISGGVQIFRAGDGHRLGLADFHAAVDIEPGHSAKVPVAIPMLSFAEGVGSLAMTAGKPKLVELELTGLDFESGKGTGETD